MPTELSELLLDTLVAEPAGLSEFELLRRLQSLRPEAFPEGLFRNSLALFRAHFLLFHALHRLRDDLLARRRGILEVDVLKVVLRPYAGAAGRALGRADPMRAYYLDLDNLEATGAQELEAMLGAFWTRYYAHGRREQALRVLGLSDPVDTAEVTRRYRRLAMHHHPDRGGDAGRFRAIREAMEVLRRC
jgi:DnaJ-domain-containing protein 1